MTLVKEDHNLRCGSLLVQFINKLRRLQILSKDDVKLLVLHSETLALSGAT